MATLATDTHQPLVTPRVRLLLMHYDPASPTYMQPMTCCGSSHPCDCA